MDIFFLKGIYFFLKKLNDSVRMHRLFFQNNFTHRKLISFFNIISFMFEV